MSDAPLTDDDLRAIDEHVARYGSIPKAMTDRVLRDLRQSRTDLAAETATREALRTQEARISGLLADAGVPVGDVVAGVERLVERAAQLAIDVEDAETAEERAGYKREAAEAERDEMRGARDRVIAECDRLRARADAAEDVERLIADAARALVDSLGEYARQSMHANREWRSGIVTIEDALIARGRRLRALVDKGKVEP